MLDQPSSFFPPLAGAPPSATRVRVARVDECALILRPDTLARHLEAGGTRFLPLGASPSSSRRVLIDSPPEVAAAVRDGLLPALRALEGSDDVVDLGAVCLPGPTLLGLALGLPIVFALPVREGVAASRSTGHGPSQDDLAAARQALATGTGDLLVSEVLSAGWIDIGDADDDATPTLVACACPAGVEGADAVLRRWVDAIERARVGSGGGGSWFGRPCVMRSHIHSTGTPLL